MRRPLITIAMITGFVSACADELELGAASQESRDTFAIMFPSVAGAWTAWRYDGYGCHCGVDSPDGVLPIDDADRCCFRHDIAWLFAAYRVGEACDCRTQAYEYTLEKGAVTCKDEQGPCAMYCCTVDKEFSECAAATPLAAANTDYDRTRCIAEGETCCQFFPEGGMTTMTPSECLGYGGVDLGADYEDCFGGTLPPTLPDRFHHNVDEAVVED
jgi:hypothetical protein